jgi:hypothetical protein
MQLDDQISDFEKHFLNEFNEKLFPPSLEQVREHNHQECQTILQQTRIYSSNDHQAIPDIINEEFPSSKLIIYEHVYLLPEEVDINSFHSILSFYFKDNLSSTCTRLFKSQR